MIRKLLFLVLPLATPSIGDAPDTPPSAAGDSSKYTRRQTVQASAVSFAIQSVWNAELLLPSVREYKRATCGYPWYVPVTLAAEPGPLYFIDKKEALVLHGLQAVFFSTEALLNSAGSYTHLSMAEHFLFTSMVSTYRLYSAMRRNSSDEVYRKTCPYHSTPDLMIAPYKPKNFLHPYTLIAIGLSASGMAIGYAAGDKSNSVWNAEKTYYTNGKEIAALPGAGLVSADLLSHNVTKGFEEAFWRGFVYEELKCRFEKPFMPRLISSVLFGLWHVAPMYTEYGFTREQIPLTVLPVIAGGYVLAIVHDNAGLEIASACHAWFNTTQGILNYLFFSGCFKKEEATAVRNQIHPGSKSCHIGIQFQF